MRWAANTTRIAQTRPLMAVWGPVRRPLSRYWSNGCSTKLSLSHPYNTLVATLRSDAYDAYDLWDEEEDDADEDRPARVADRLTAVGVDWALLAGPPTTDWIVRELAHDIVSRWEERRTAFVEGHLPSAMVPHKRERFVLTLAMEEMEARGPGTTVDDVMPTVEAKIRDLEALRRRREME